MSRLFSSLLCGSLLVALVGCGQKNESEETASFTAGHIIVGSLDWKNVTGLSASSGIRKNSKAIAMLDLPVMGSRCTGFLVTENIVMTNEHCIPTARHARGVTATFNKEKGVGKRSLIKYRCDEFIGNDKELDFALLRCEGSPGEKYGIVTLDANAKRAGSGLYVVQQNCDYYSIRSCDPTKKYSQGKITKVTAEYGHDADTLGGSSGSPVFSESGHKVIAIHHAGFGNNGRGRGIENYAVPMSKIVPHILSHFPNVGIKTSGSVSTTPSASGDKAGDTFATAKKISTPMSASFKIGTSKDIDIFKFSLRGLKSVSIKISLLKKAGDLDLYLLDSRGSVVAKSTTTKKTESISKRLSSGDYYLGVVGYKGAKGSYKLSVK